jgi:LacI family transcriptional regulator
MRDVAAEAGVALATVSRVLNDAPGVHPETAERVRRAVEATGFRRNEIARRLRSGRETATIGLLVEDLGNPFHSALAAGVEAVARRHSTSVVIASCGEDPSVEQDAVLGLCERRVDGLVVVPAGDDHTYLRDELAAGMQMVFVDRPAVGIAVDEVVSDNRRGARLAVEHLLAAGHRRIGVVTDRESIWTHGERVAGYRDAMAAAGAPARAEWVAAGNRTPAEAEEATRSLLTRTEATATALFTTNNRMTVGALGALRTSPGVALVGFDDFELADRLTPPVTVLTNDAYALGTTAAEVLFARIAGDRRQPQRTVLRGSLRVRGSGEIPPPEE